MPEISRTSICPDCGRDLHVCRNCQFYAPGQHYDCHETVDEPVRNKERANFCDYFKPRKDFAATSTGSGETSKARDAFAALFGN